MVLADAARAAGARGRGRAPPTTARNGRAILRRISAAGLAQLAAAPSLVSARASAGARDGWGDAAEHPAWQLEAGYDAAIGTLAHAWLERIGRDGIAAWPATALASRLSRHAAPADPRRHPASQADAAAEAVLERCRPILSDPRGQWLLSQSGARREWPLIDAAGKISVIDLALSTETAGSSSTTRPAVPSPANPQRPLPRACANATARAAALLCPGHRPDGRPTRAALYFPGRARG